MASRVGFSRKYRDELWIAFVFGAWVVDGCVSRAAPRLAELPSTLLVGAACACALVRFAGESSRREAAVNDARLLALAPCLALALEAMLSAWWRGILHAEALFAATTYAVLAPTLLAPIAMGAAKWIVERLVTRSLDHERWLPRAQRFAKALAVLATLLVLAAVARRATTETPDAFGAIAASRMPPFVASTDDLVALRIDDDRALVVRDVRPSQSGASLELRDRRRGQLEFIEFVFANTRIQFSQRLGCVRLVNFGRGEVRCLAHPDRAATAWTERRSLAPTFSWLSMGVIGVGLLLYATRQREHRRWRRAAANVDESVTVDGVRFDAGRGVKIPHNSHELWVVTDERSSGSGPYREQSTREVLEVRVEPPFERDWRKVRWAIASALLFLTPLVFALCVGMIAG